MRQARDQCQAEDIAASGFCTASPAKAGKLSDSTLIGGWLIQSTHFVAKKFSPPVPPQRTKHEHEAADMKRNPLQEQKISIKLRRIAGRDPSHFSDQTSRGILVMQYLEGRNGKEIALPLGISEEARENEPRERWQIFGAHLGCAAWPFRRKRSPPD